MQFEIVQVEDYSAIEIKYFATNRSWVVNGQKLKPCIGRKIRSALIHQTITTKQKLI